VIDLPDVPGAAKTFKYDEEWLSIIKASMPFYSTSSHYVKYPAKLSVIHFDLLWASYSPLTVI